MIAEKHYKIWKIIKKDEEKQWQDYAKTWVLINCWLDEITQRKPTSVC